VQLEPNPNIDAALGFNGALLAGPDDPRYFGDDNKNSQRME
jgi:hypothetical protein